jgi:hypothetical protein
VDSAFAYCAHCLTDGFDPAGLMDVRGCSIGCPAVGRGWRATSAGDRHGRRARHLLGIGPKAPQLAQPTEHKAELFKRWLDQRLMAGVIGHDAGWLAPTFLGR